VNYGYGIWVLPWFTHMMLLISLAHRSHGGFGGHAVAAEVLPETTD
jgi:hypothetical protein